MDDIIKTDKICRDFKNGKQIIKVLKNVNLCVQKSSLTILKGRSGSGKTTLLNLIGALDYPDSGHIFFEDNDITKLGEIERDTIRKYKMGFVFQSVALLPLMSAYENVDFGLRIAGYKGTDRKERVIKCLELVGLQKRMSHRPGEMSGGEQQRVAIARAIAHKPQVIFADEPTAELDTHMGLQIMKVFRELVDNEKITIIMTTHDPNMMELGDHVFELEDGEIVNEQ